MGKLFGLEAFLDIRHIAFSAAYVGYAAAAYDFVVPNAQLSVTIAGVLLIGLINLLVSFNLALYVAMRSRGITFAQGRVLSTLVLRRFISRPQDFFFPPRSAEASTPAHEHDAAHPGNGNSSADPGRPHSTSDHAH